MLHSWMNKKRTYYFNFLFYSNLYFNKKNYNGWIHTLNWPLIIIINSFTYILIWITFTYWKFSRPLLTYLKWYCPSCCLSTYVSKVTKLSSWSYMYMYLFSINVYWFESDKSQLAKKKKIGFHSLSPPPFKKEQNRDKTLAKNKHDKENKKFKTL